MSISYDQLGHTYSRTRRADPVIVRTVRSMLELRPEGSYLDLGCGCGHYTAALAQDGGRWEGLDCSELMLSQAGPQRANVSFRRGYAEHLPYRDREFDGAICINAVHFLDIAEAVTEIHRVLHAGSLIIFTMFAEQLQRYWLTLYFPRMMSAASAAMPSRDQLLAQLAHAGFENVTVVPFHVQRDLVDLFLYCGKQRPELYFDPAIRANISQFARFGDPAEVRAGLHRLGADLKTGAFSRLMTSEDPGLGDCAYVVATKAVPMTNVPDGSTPLATTRQQRRVS